MAGPVNTSLQSTLHGGDARSSHQSGGTININRGIKQKDVLIYGALAIALIYAYKRLF